MKEIKTVVDSMVTTVTLTEFISFNKSEYRYLSCTSSYYFVILYWDCTHMYKCYKYLSSPFRVGSLQVC